MIRIGQAASFFDELGAQREAKLVVTIDMSAACISAVVDRASRSPGAAHYRQVNGTAITSQHTRRNWALAMSVCIRSKKHCAIVFHERLGPGMFESCPKTFAPGSSAATSI